MIFSPYKISLFFGLTASSGAVCVGCSYEFTKKTISDSLGEVKFVSLNNSETAWNKLLTKIKDTNNQKKSEKFKSFNTLKTEEQTESNLKNFCQDSGKEIYYTIFSKDENLMKDVKLFCSITIKEMLEQSKLLNVSGETPSSDETNILTTKLTALTTHNEDQNGKLDDLLLKLKTDNSSQDRENRLFAWCKKTYDFYYVSESQDLKKLAYRYCIKE